MLIVHYSWKIILYVYYYYLIYVFMLWEEGHVCHCISVEVKGQFCGVSPSTSMYISGIEFSYQVSVATIFNF